MSGEIKLPFRIDYTQAKPSWVKGPSFRRELDDARETALSMMRWRPDLYGTTATITDRRDGREWVVMLEGHTEHPLSEAELRQLEELLSRSLSDNRLAGRRVTRTGMKRAGTDLARALDVVRDVLEEGES